MPSSSWHTTAPPRLFCYVQDKALKAGTGRSNLMVRYGGASLGAVGMHVVAAGYCDDVKVQRRAAKIVAGHSALVAGMAAAQLSGAPPPACCFCLGRRPLHTQPPNAHMHARTYRGSILRKTKKHSPVFQTLLELFFLIV